jgi:hypothetical protein
MIRPILYAPHNFDEPGGIEECIPYHVVTTSRMKFPVPDAKAEESLHDYVIMLSRFPINPLTMFEGRLTFLPCLN